MQWVLIPPTLRKLNLKETQRFGQGHSLVRRKAGFESRQLRWGAQENLLRARTQGASWKCDWSVIWPTTSASHKPPTRTEPVPSTGGAKSASVNQHVLLWGLKPQVELVEPWNKRNSLSRVQLFETLWIIVHGIVQARILEWIAFPFFRGSPQPTDWI